MHARIYATMKMFQKGGTRQRCSCEILRFTATVASRISESKAKKKKSARHRSAQVPITTRKGTFEARS